MRADAGEQRTRVEVRPGEQRADRMRWAARYRRSPGSPRGRSRRAGRSPARPRSTPQRLRSPPKMKPRKKISSTNGAKTSERTATAMIGPMLSNVPSGRSASGLDAEGREDSEVRDHDAVCGKNERDRQPVAPPLRLAQPERAPGHVVLADPESNDRDQHQYLQDNAGPDADGQVGGDRSRPGRTRRSGRSRVRAG